MKLCYWVPLRSYRAAGDHRMVIVETARRNSAEIAMRVLDAKFHRTVEHYLDNPDAHDFLMARQWNHKVWAFPSGEVIMEVLLEEADLVEYKLTFAEPDYARLRVVGDTGPTI